MNMRKAARAYLKYAREHGIRRLYEVFPAWLKDHHPSIYRSSPGVKQLENIPHKNDHGYRAQPTNQKALTRQRRLQAYNTIASEIFRPCSCVVCGKLYELNTKSRTPVAFDTALCPPKFCSIQCASRSEQVRSKTRKTNLLRHGVTCTLNSRSSIQKKQATWKKKYGVTNPSQAPEIVEQILQSRYGRKTLMLHGKEFHYQGYESTLLRHLVYKLDVDVAHLTTDAKKVSMFEYNYGGRTHKYLPDIKAALPNGAIWYFEVKSVLTLNVTRPIQDRVYAKALSMWDRGKRYSVVLCDQSKILAYANNARQLRQLFQDFPRRPRRTS